MATSPEQLITRAAPDWLAGGGEMDALMRAIDWSATPLGPIGRWPQSLRTALSICLMSRFPMAVCWGPSYVILYNDAYRPILGTKHPWAMGRPCFEVWSELAYIVRPMFDAVLETGVATWSDDLMLPMLRHGYLEEAYFTLSYSAIRGESSLPEGVFVTCTETTQRYLAERRLRLVHELGDAAASARSPEQAAILAGEILAGHAADVPFSLLYRVDAAAGEACLAATTGVQRGHPAAPERVSLADRGARPWPLGQLLDGSETLVVDDLAEAGPLPGGIWPEPARAAVLLPIPGPGHAGPIAVLVAGVNPRRALVERHHEFFRLVARQIANILANAIAHEETRRRAEALAELDRAKTAFFSNVSHEFRTPLTLMLGPLEDVLAETDGLPPKSRERLEVAHRNSLRLLKLVNTLLDFSRIEAGRVQAAYEPADLSTLTAELASVFRSAIERAGLRLVVDCPPLDEPVYVDREMWEKIVLNLLSNAFKFTFEGEIEVSLRKAGETVELAVRDTGTGIPAEEIPHLFERFHRVKGARGRSFEGSGIGLALVQELAELHGGTVRVESEVDRGTAFTVSLPTGQAHLPADRIGAARAVASTGPRSEAYVEEVLRWLPEESSEIRDRNPSPARILLADDNADMREYVRRLLGEKYEVVAVPDGAAALRAAREQPFDLVLSDVMMPRLDGFGLL
ncbi:MAG: ATP-binding protein, partial [Thermoanaerobaculia bacterium]